MRPRWQQALALLTSQNKLAILCTSYVQEKDISYGYVPAFRVSIHGEFLRGFFAWLLTGCSLILYLRFYSQVLVKKCLLTKLAKINTFKLTYFTFYITLW